jgi:Zn finger protein HypA/HybF involved in hydrogenase expression
MENTEYKCLCCGSIGCEEEFGINSKSNFTSTSDFAICPHCGSMDIDMLVTEIDYIG